MAKRFRSDDIEENEIGMFKRIHSLITDRDPDITVETDDFIDEELQHLTWIASPQYWIVFTIFKMAALEVTNLPEVIITMISHYMEPECDVCVKWMAIDIDPPRECILCKLHVCTFCAMHKECPKKEAEEFGRDGHKFK